MLRRIHASHLVFALLVLCMGLVSVHTLSSIYQDIGRHIVLGDLIRSTHHIPTTNLFSYTNTDFPFLNHHWLAEVLLSVANSAIGLRGLIVLKAILVAVAFGMALAAAWRGRNALAGCAIGLLAGLVILERTDVRPEILSFVFLGWFLLVLYRFPHSRLVWTLPVVQALWVNSHIYFFMGPFVYAAFVLQNSAVLGWRAALNRRTILLGALLAGATLLNPSGLSGALYPLFIFRSYGYSVMENKSPFFLASFGYPPATSFALYAMLILSGAVAVANMHRWRENLMGNILVLGTGALALAMIRNFPLAALVAMPMALHHANDLNILRGRGTTPAIAGLGLILASIISGQFYATFGIPGRAFGRVVPEGYAAPVAFFRSAGIRGPIFNNFDVGSYLIWQLPEEKVFIDGRPEAYPADFIQNIYIGMQERADLWDIYVKKYGINAVFWNTQDITPWSITFVRRISGDRAWVRVWNDDGISIWVKNTPQNTDIIQRYAR